MVLPFHFHYESNANVRVFRDIFQSDFRVDKLRFDAVENYVQVIEKKTIPKQTIKYLNLGIEA